MTTALWAGRATVEEVYLLQDKLFQWALGSSESEAITQKVVNCLQEDFLLSLLQLEDNHHWPANPTTQNWRYLCRRQIARLLRWKKLYPKGHPWGILDFLNKFLQTQHWPTFLDEKTGETSSRGAIGSHDRHQHHVLSHAREVAPTAIHDANPTLEARSQALPEGHVDGGATEALGSKRGRGRKHSAVVVPSVGRGHGGRIGRGRGRTNWSRPEIVPNLTSPPTLRRQKPH